MVRHEAAEALGGIATDDCLPVLEEMAKDSSVPRVVRESCEVALDMVRLQIRISWLQLTSALQQFEYERSGTLHYAPPLTAVA